MMLAQVAPIPNTGASTSVDVLVWVGALIVAVLILGIAILLIRKRLFEKDTEEVSSMLGELRRMHKSGELTTEEYDAARKALTINVANRIVPPKASNPAPEKPATHQKPAPARREAPGEVRAKPGFDLTGGARGGAHRRPPPRPPPRARATTRATTTTSSSCRQAKSVRP